MRVVLSKNAADYLRRERDYLEQVNPRAARRVMEHFKTAFQLLARHPQAGAPLPLDGRRRYVCGAYVIDYSLENLRLVVSHIRHGQQADPDLALDDDGL
ncbi:type II toxin-antitoxin system RelE/ParE family toxin [Rhizobium sp. FY34]|uniref:type II toxin-antitoxin system RelE/ParE family toxin n=1 Tax=Rhizobium sp. FY34 TaxID=2562309 RepID=UPI0010BF8009|nr:type II toxin-antitoxin system RelE/ParE family toxin [Rhizobium sp. FY34]